MRVFTGIELSTELEQNIKKLLKVLEQYNDKIKLVSPKNLHITLRFLGNINQQEYEEFSNILLSTVPPVKKFQVELNGIGFFPSKSKPRVIWVGVDKNERLKQLYQITENAARKIGLPEENRFQGHVTAGRIKYSINPEIISKIENEFGKTCWGKMIVDHITIFESTFHQQGPEYKQLLNIPLGGNENG